jgi:hypothetical protein
MKGKKLLSLVPSYSLKNNGMLSITNARHFVKTNRIQPPAIISVTRNSVTTDCFFWGEPGMFSLAYAEHNWFNFKCLMRIVDQHGYDNLFNDVMVTNGAFEVEGYAPEFYRS